MRARLASKGLDHLIVNLGVLGCLVFAEHWQQRRCHSQRSLPAGYASAADIAVKAPKPVAEVPFFLVIDNRVSFSWMPKGTDPGMFTVNPNGSVNGKTAKQVYSFTHFDAWAYGTNFFTISMFKSGHNDPASPCIAPASRSAALPANCAGATEIYGLFRSTFGFNQMFNTKAFTMGPLRNVSFEVGMDANTENNFLALPSATSSPVCSSPSICLTRVTSTSRR